VTPSTPDADAGRDSGTKGTAVGLRVKFIGAEHSFGADDESSLHEQFAADTTLTPTRVVSVTLLDAAFLADTDVLVLDRVQRVFSDA
jgi:hypothetical protein